MIMEYNDRLFHISIHWYHKRLIQEKNSLILFFLVYFLIWPVVEYKSKKLEQKRKISIFKFIDEYLKLKLQKK
jgi:hypothetical protein